MQSEAQNAVNPNGLTSILTRQCEKSTLKKRGSDYSRLPKEIFMSFFSTTLGKLIITFFVSMVPVIELRGAIPIGVGMGLPFWAVIFVSIIGNLIPVPFIIIFIKKIFAFMREKMPKLDGLVTRLENKANSKSETVQKYAFWGLFIFVAIPLPGTGAWTGALIAAMLEMKLKKAFPSIVLGVLSAGAIVTFVTYLVPVIARFFA